MPLPRLTVFGMAVGRLAIRENIEPALTSPQGLDVCRQMIDQLAGGAEAVDVPFPLVEGSSQRLMWGVPFLDELDETCRRAFETVAAGWPGHLFSLLDVRRPKNRRLAAGVVMPYDSTEDLFDALEAGTSGERLATGLVIPDQKSAAAHDALGELAQVMLVAALGQSAAQPHSSVKPFTAEELLAAGPSLLLDVQHVDSAEFAGRLISFTGHYSLALLK